MHDRRTLLRGLAATALALPLAGCTDVPATLPVAVTRRYGPLEDGGFRIAAVPHAYLTSRNQRVTVAYTGPEPAGTIVVDPHARVLYLVTGPERALRYGVAVGWEGRNFAGEGVIGRKAAWPPWRPTPNMIRQNPELYAPYAAGLPPGPPNPLGARALYLYRAGRDTYYRIHGTQEAGAVGKATVAGCIRLFNQDAIDLHDRVPVGARVRVRGADESARLEGRFAEGSDGYLRPA
ncbi:MAG: L,D-transpeptidase [Rhodobacteraceae bacterium]|jgi:lipoprotein-anchoring transpeptidase ErfK/SrfK|nr:L,D-transpeptidase [Paracoccaceae bacterium]